MSRKKHGQQHEEHMDESWLIPYADILTLLLALFIVLFASAQVDQKKFNELAQSFTNAFRGDTSIFENTQSAPQVIAAQPMQPQIEKISAPLNNTNDKREKEYMHETVQLLEVKRTLDKYIADNKLTGELETEFTDDGLLIRIKDTALFLSGSANLIADSRQLGVEITKMLAPLTQQVIISGHTDNMPINTAEFPSNWDLSSKRALNFMKFLLAEDAKLKPERFSAIGYGEYRPIRSNDTADGRTQNRRVEVLIVRNVRI